jgi:coproporphyrinogen III oxidase
VSTQRVCVWGGGAATEHGLKVSWQGVGLHDVEALHPRNPHTPSMHFNCRQA